MTFQPEADQQNGTEILLSVLRLTAFGSGLGEPGLFEGDETQDHEWPEIEPERTRFILTRDIDASEHTLPLDDTYGLSRGSMLDMGNAERAWVQNVQSATEVAVTRGAAGTRAEEHPAGASIGSVGLASKLGDDSPMLQCRWAHRSNGWASFSATYAPDETGARARAPRALANEVEHALVHGREAMRGLIGLLRDDVDVLRVSRGAITTRPAFDVLRNEVLDHAHERIQDRPDRILLSQKRAVEINDLYGPRMQDTLAPFRMVPCADWPDDAVAFVGADSVAVGSPGAAPWREIGRFDGSREIRGSLTLAFRRPWCATMVSLPPE